MDNPKALESLKIRIVRNQRSYSCCLLSIFQLHLPNIYLQVRSFPGFKTLLGVLLHPWKCFRFHWLPSQNHLDFLWTLCVSLFHPDCFPKSGNSWEGRVCVVFISTSSLGPPNNVSECIGGIYLLPLLKGLSSDKNMEYYKYLQKWLFITVQRARQLHTLYKPGLHPKVMYHMAFL